MVQTNETHMICKVQWSQSTYDYLESRLTTYQTFIYIRMDNWIGFSAKVIEQMPS